MKDDIPSCPWGKLDEGGDSLPLEQFLSFKIVRLANALQRVSAREYLDPQGLTVSDWRVLALVRRYGPVRFGEVAQRSSLDKAQVSRTVRNLRERGLLQAEGDADHAQRIVLSVTPAGKRVHAQVLPRAARAQTRLLRTLAPADREALWRCLHLLQEQIGDDQATSPSTRSSRE